MFFCRILGLVALLVVGDDEPDEDMFATARAAGCGFAAAVLVRDEAVAAAPAAAQAVRTTRATHAVADPGEVAQLLQRIATARAEAAPAARSHGQ